MVPGNEACQYVQQDTGHFPSSDPSIPEATTPHRPPSHPHQRQTACSPIDSNFWHFVDRVIFTREEVRGRAPLIKLVDGIRSERYLINCYGQTQIDKLLAPIDTKADYIHLPRRLSERPLVKWVSMSEFRDMCASLTPIPSPSAVSMGFRKGVLAESSAPVAGYAFSPKRHRGEGYTHDQSAAPRALVEGGDPSTCFRESHSTPLPPPSIAAGINMDKQKLLEHLQQISDEYLADDGATTAALEAEARVEGVLGGFGGARDPLRHALAAVEETLRKHSAARREAGGKDWRDRAAEIEVRMGKDVKEEMVRARMSSLAPAEVKEVHHVLRQGKATDVVARGFNVDMRRQDLQTCNPGTWLNDEVINFFMSLLKERDDSHCAAAAARGVERRKNWFFNSFFLSKLLDDNNGYKYANVRRWSRKAGDLFSYDKVFFPVNIRNTHWCLAVIYMQEKKIQYFDSLVGTGREYLVALRQYIADEHQDKKKSALDISDWELVSSDRQVVPQQGNGADCGCFASAFAYLLSEDLPINYISQADMPAFRQRLVYSIVKKALNWNGENA